MSSPLITIAVPSYNQGDFLDQALSSIFSQNLAVEVIVLDGGSTDNSLEVIKEWEPRLSWWRSGADQGQAAAINEGIRRGSAPYVCWLNSDDLFLPGGLVLLLDALRKNAQYPAVYGKCWNIGVSGEQISSYWTQPFSSWLLANRCIISQPATLIRRSSWEQVGGLDESLDMALDYDLWWRLYVYGGDLLYLRQPVAANRRHGATKTSCRRRDHYVEAMRIVRKYYGKVPLKWYICWPIMVTCWQILHDLQCSSKS